MAEINEIKERMEKLELNQAQGSKDIEGLHSRLNQIEEELHKRKIELSETIKKEVNESVSWEMEGVKKHHSIVRILAKQTRASFGKHNYYISVQYVKGRPTILKFKAS